MDAVEIFAGARAITDAVLGLGYKAEALDVSYGSEEKWDLRTKAGLDWAMQRVFSLRIGGTLWCAPVCSSWVWVSSATSGRSAERPEGNTEREFVRDGNHFMMITSALALLAHLRKCAFYIEQPASSVMWKAEPMKTLIAWIAKYRVSTPLGSYGADSRKQIVVQSNMEMVGDLHRRPPKEVIASRQNPPRMTNKARTENKRVVPKPPRTPMNHYT